jgi:hypothetical protein
VSQLDRHSSVETTVSASVAVSALPTFQVQRQPGGHRSIDQEVTSLDESDVPKWLEFWQILKTNHVISKEARRSARAVNVGSDVSKYNKNFTAAPSSPLCWIRKRRELWCSF